MSGSTRVSPLAAAAIVVVAAGLGIGAALVWNSLDDDGTVVTSSGPDATTVEVTPRATPTVDPPAVATSTPIPSPAAVEPSPAPEAGADPAMLFGDAVIADAIARANTEGPGTGLPGRDPLTTSRLEFDLNEGGNDLTGADVAVYRTSAAGVFALIETDDSNALLASGSPDGFVVALIESAAVTEYGVDRVVLRHSTSDEQGPMIVTMTIGIDPIRAAIDSDTSVDFSQFAVQVERP